MDTRTDIELIAAFAASGDEPFDRVQGEAAFAGLVRRHQQMVFRTCLRMLNDAHEAQDATQATFIVLMKKTDRLKREGAVGGWLHAVARRVSLEAIQRRAAEAKRREAANAVAEAGGAEAAVDMDAVLRCVDEEIEGLSTIQRQAVVLRYLEGHGEREAAQLAGCPVGTLSRRASDGIARLRNRLARRGFALGIPVLAAALEAEASAAIPETLLSSTMTAVKAYAAGGALPGVVLGTQTGATDLPGVALGAKTGAVSANVVVLTKGVLNMMFWNGVKIGVAVAVGVAAVAGGSMAAVRVVGEKESSPTGPSRTGIAQHGTNTVFVTPRDSRVWTVFEELERKGGAKVSVWAHASPLVPVELRFTPVEGRKLVDAVAAANTLKVAWWRDGKYAVLYRGAPDKEIESFRKELAGPDVVSRRQRLWREFLLSDIRIVPLLVKAAKDPDAETARQALMGLHGLGLYGLGWNTVVVLDETAFDLLTAMSDSPNSWVRQEAVTAFGNVGGEKALALIEKAFDDKDAKVREAAVKTLGRVGGGKALALIEKAFDDKDTYVRQAAVSVLAYMGGEKALAFIEKAFDDEDAAVRGAAVYALGYVGGEKALALIEKAFDNKDTYMRRAAAIALGNMGGEKALALIEKALDDKDVDVRLAALHALGNVGGEKALVLLEKALDNKDASVRLAAPAALGKVGGEKALLLIKKALYNEDANVRWQAVRALGEVGGEKALLLIEKALDNKDDSVRWAAVIALGNVGGEKALALLAKALDDKDVWVRRATASALGNVGGEKALALLAKTLDDKDSSVREEAVRALECVGGEKAPALVEKAFNDKVSDVRLSAIRVLPFVGGEKALDLLLGRLTSEEDDSVLGAIDHLLRQYSPGDPVVEKALNEVHSKLSKRKVQPPQPVPPQPSAIRSVNGKTKLLDGQKLMQAGKFEDAIAVFADAQAMAGDQSDETNAEILYWMGECYRGLGNTNRANAVFKNLTGKYPVTTWADSARERLAGKQGTK